LGGVEEWRWRGGPQFFLQGSQQERLTQTVVDALSKCVGRRVDQQSDNILGWLQIFRCVSSSAKKSRLFPCGIVWEKNKVGFETGVLLNVLAWESGSMRGRLKIFGLSECWGFWSEKWCLLRCLVGSEPAETESMWYLDHL
jgi:hypothetical protein